MNEDTLKRFDELSTFCHHYAKFSYSRVHPKYEHVYECAFSLKTRAAEIARDAIMNGADVDTLKKRVDSLIETIDSKSKSVFVHGLTKDIVHLKSILEEISESLNSELQQDKAPSSKTKL